MNDPVTLLLVTMYVVCTASTAIVLSKTPDIPKNASTDVMMVGLACVWPVVWGIIATAVVVTLLSKAWHRFRGDL